MILPVHSSLVLNHDFRDETISTIYWRGSSLVELLIVGSDRVLGRSKDDQIDNRVNRLIAEIVVQDKER